MLDETKWLCQNAKELEKFSGRWVMFSVKEGLVSCANSLNKMMKSARKHKVSERPFVFHVPSRDELNSPLPSIHKK